MARAISRKQNAHTTMLRRPYALRAGPRAIPSRLLRGRLAAAKLAHQQPSVDRPPHIRSCMLEGDRLAWHEADEGLTASKTRKARRSGGRALSVPAPQQYHLACYTVGYSPHSSNTRKRPLINHRTSPVYLMNTYERPRIH